MPTPLLDLPGMGFPASTNSASHLLFDPVLSIRPKSAADIDDDLFSEADMTWLMTSGASDDVHFNEPLASPVYGSLRLPHPVDSLATAGNAGPDLALPELGAWTMPQLQFPHSIAAAASASPIQLVSLQSTAVAPAQDLSLETTAAHGAVHSNVWSRQPPLQPIPVRGTYPRLAQLDTENTLMSTVFLLQDPSKLVSGIPPLPRHSKHPSVIKPTAAQSQEPASTSVFSPTLRDAALSHALPHASSDQSTQQLGQLQPSFAQLPANDSPALSSCLLELQALAVTRTRAQQQPRVPYCPSNLHPTLISHLDSHALLSYGSIEDSFEFTRDLGMHQQESLISATDGNALTTRSPLTSKLRSQNNLVGMVDMLGFGFSNVECTHYDATSLDNSDASLLMRAGRSPALVQAAAAVKVPADTLNGLAAISVDLAPKSLTFEDNSKQVCNPVSQHPLVSSSGISAAPRHRTSDSSAATAGSGDSCAACNSGCSLHSECGSSHDDHRNRNVQHNLLLSGSSSLDAYLTSLADSDSSRDLCVSWTQRQLHMRGCQAISSLLSATASVRVLSLTHCLINDNDVLELVPGLLLGPSCIAVLDLSHNMIGDSGIRELSLCLSKSSTLEMLHLSHNRIGDAGATVLAAAARRCPSLSHLHLQGNSQVSATALKLIATSLSSAKRRRRNSTLGFFDVIPGSSSSSSIAAQAEVHGAGAIESSAAAMDFGTRSRFASVSCEREPETILQVLLRPTSPPELQVTGLVRQITRRGTTSNVPQPQALGAHALAEQLAAHGVQASVKAARGSSSGGSCLRNLRHEYVTCNIPSTSFTAPGSTACLEDSIGSGLVIVDPTFRDSFEISVMTPAYRKLLEQIPDVLVAAPHRLPLVVQFLCDRMHEAFLEHKVTVPPWREATSIMTKYGAATA